MKIAITGSSGLVGKALQDFFSRLGTELVLLKRTNNRYVFKESDFEGVDAVINLAGESISRRWSASVKQQIKASRVETTRKLSSVLQKLKQPPKLIINASAIGYYGASPEKT